MRPGMIRPTRRRVIQAMTGALAYGALGGTSRALAAEYVVQPGDTLASIAARFNTSVDALARANGIADPNFIVSGQTLTVPGSSAAPASRPAAAQAPGSILANRRILTYYGNPFDARMGILGAVSKGALVDAVRNRAAQYEAAGGKPVQPALHMVVTVAQAGPGADGLYRARMPGGVIQEYIDLAAANGMLFIADIQVGRSTVEAEIAAMRRFLVQPNVHLALDPEFDMWGNQVPGRELGHMTAAEVNHGIRVLADIAAQTGQQKILIVHQFAYSMLPDKHAIGNDPRVDVSIIMDGFGGPGIKIKHYNMLVRDSHIEFGGIKLFFDQDVNLMTPADVMSLTPTPDVIIYQ